MTHTYTNIDLMASRLMAVTGFQRLFGNARVYGDTGHYSGTEIPAYINMQLVESARHKMAVSLEVSDCVRVCPRFASLLSIWLSRRHVLASARERVVHSHPPQDRSAKDIGYYNKIP